MNFCLLDMYVRYAFRQYKTYTSAKLGKIAEFHPEKVMVDGWFQVSSLDCRVLSAVS